MSEFKNGVILIDENSSIQYIDEIASSVLGLNEDSTDKKLDSLINDESFHQLIKQSIETNSSSSSEIYPEWAREKTLFVKITPYQTKNDKGFMIVVTDLTSLRRLEGMQKEFVANVSHELRTPLTSIKMAAESLQLGAISDDRMKDKFLSNIQREADRLTRLVNELLVLANLDNKVTLHISGFNPGELLSDVVTVMRHHASLNDITLIDDFEEELPLMQADKDRIQQVIINLTDNAIKCNRQNGKVTLSARPEGDYLTVKVKDTGIGIHKVDIDKIFDRFFRVDRSRSRVTGGTGLGLSIVKDIIVAHGGSINVESEVDVGTTFIIKLPFKSNVPQEEQ